MVRGTRRGLTWGSRSLLANRRPFWSSRERTGARARTKWHRWNLLAGGFNNLLEAPRLMAAVWRSEMTYLLTFKYVSRYVLPLGGHWCLAPLCLLGGGPDDYEHSDTVPFSRCANMNVHWTLCWRDIWAEYILLTCGTSAVHLRTWLFLSDNCKK